MSAVIESGILASRTGAARLVHDALLDLGTGTGTLARGFARRGCTVTGLDAATTLIAAPGVHAAVPGRLSRAGLSPSTTPATITPNSATMRCAPKASTSAPIGSEASGDIDHVIM